MKYLDVYKKIRKTWSRNPKTQILPTKKRKARINLKAEIKKEIEREV